jgi:hypothetical protein
MAWASSDNESRPTGPAPPYAASGNAVLHSLLSGKRAGRALSIPLHAGRLDADM